MLHIYYILPKVHRSRYSFWYLRTHSVTSDWLCGTNVIRYTWSLYFTLTTLTTVGYGDWTADSLLFAFLTLSSLAILLHLGDITPVLLNCILIGSSGWRESGSNSSNPLRTTEECRWVLLLLLTSAVIFSGLLGMLSDLVASVNKDGKPSGGGAFTFTATFVDSSAGTSSHCSQKEAACKAPKSAGIGHDRDILKKWLELYIPALGKIRDWQRYMAWRAVPRALLGKAWNEICFPVCWIAQWPSWTKVRRYFLWLGKQEVNFRKLGSPHKIHVQLSGPDKIVEIWLWSSVILGSNGVRRRSRCFECPFSAQCTQLNLYTLYTFIKWNVAKSRTMTCMKKRSSDHWHQLCGLIFATTSTRTKPEPFMASVRT